MTHRSIPRNKREAKKKRERVKVRGAREKEKKDPMGNGSNNLSGPDCRFEARRGDRTPFPTVNPIHRLVCPQWWCRIINKRLPRAGYLLCRFVIRCTSHLCTYNGLTNRFSWKKREKEKKINKKGRKKERNVEKSRLRINTASAPSLNSSSFFFFSLIFPWLRFYLV